MRGLQSERTFRFKDPRGSGGAVAKTLSDFRRPR